VCKRLHHLLYSENEIYTTFLWLKFRLKSLAIAKGTVIITIMTKVVSVSDVTNKVRKHVLSLDSGTKHQHYLLLRRLEIIFNTLLLPLYKRGKGQGKIFK